VWQKKVVGQFQKSSFPQRRKGAKTSTQRIEALNSLAVFLCAFAPLREILLVNNFKLTHYLEDKVSPINRAQ
jgi:hypothetical protein